MNWLFWESNKHEDRFLKLSLGRNRCSFLAKQESEVEVSPKLQISTSGAQKNARSERINGLLKTLANQKYEIIIFGVVENIISKALHSYFSKLRFFRNKVLFWKSPWYVPLETPTLMGSHYMNVVGRNQYSEQHSCEIYCVIFQENGIVLVNINVHEILNAD